MVHTILKPLPHRTLWQAVRGFCCFWQRTAPSRDDIHRKYNLLRQEYILDTTRNHFHKRADDPAPLYNKKLLDIGCGTSTINTFMALSGADVTAVDPDRRALETAEKYAQNYGIDINFLNGKVESLVQSGEKYDVILCLDVLEYIDKPERFLWSLRQLLKSNGIIIFSAINRTPKAWFVHIFLSYYLLKRTKEDPRRWEFFYRPLKLREMMAGEHLAVKTIQGMIFDIENDEWRLYHEPDTRYLGTATPI